MPGSGWVIAVSALDDHYFDGLAEGFDRDVLTEGYDLDELGEGSDESYLGDLEADYDELAIDGDSADFGEVLAEALSDEHAYATPAELDDVLVDVLENMSPAEEISFSSVLGALPAAAQLGGTLIGGPVVGSVLGGAATSVLPRRRPVAAPSSPASPQPSPGASTAAQPSIAAQKALVLLGREDQCVQKALAKLALGQPGPVAGKPVGALVNMLGAFLQQAAVAADKSLAVGSGLPAYPGEADDESYADLASAEYRAEELYGEVVDAEDGYLIEAAEEA